MEDENGDVGKLPLTSLDSRPRIGVRGDLVLAVENLFDFACPLGPLGPRQS